METLGDAEYRVVSGGRKCLPTDALQQDHVEVDAELLAKARETTGRHADAADSAVVERVLNRYLLMALIESINSGSDLSEEEAERMAVRTINLP